jgi:hypothetical protein
MIAKVHRDSLVEPFEDLAAEFGLRPACVPLSVVNDHDRRADWRSTAASSMRWRSVDTSSPPALAPLRSSRCSASWPGRTGAGWLPEKQRPHRTARPKLRPITPSGCSPQVWADSRRRCRSRRDPTRPHDSGQPRAYPLPAARIPVYVLGHIGSLTMTG